MLLLERGRFPRHKVCGEFVSAESLDLLSALLATSQNLTSIAPRISNSRIFIDNAVLSAEINPPAASIARLNLDAALWESCIHAGVTARDESTVQAVEGSGPFQVKTNAGSFTAKAFINATGRWSNFTPPALRARMSRERWIGIKAHFQEPDAARSVDLYFFPGGYCGVQPVSASRNDDGAQINVCAMVRADVARCMEDVLRCHPALFERSRNWKGLMDPISTSPLVFHDPQPVAGAIVHIGDSATFVDPFIGDGISLALRSGHLAAKCLKSFFAGTCLLEHSLETYRTAYAQDLAPVFRNSARLRNMLRWPRAVRKPVLSFLQRTPAITRQLVRMTR